MLLYITICYYILLYITIYYYILLYIIIYHYIILYIIYSVCEYDIIEYQINSNKY